MEIPAAVTHALGRPLSAEEAELLRCLSASGVAKLNADLCRGANLATTMAEMLTVRHHQQSRRVAALERLTPAARLLLAQLSWPWPTEVVVLCAEAPLDEILSGISLGMAQGDSLVEVLEELASERLMKKVQLEAEHLQRACGVPVNLRRLAPTVAAGNGDVVSTTSTELCPVKFLLGPSAVAMWFDRPLQPCQLSQTIPSPPAADGLAGPRSPNAGLTSILKAPPCFSTACSPSSGSLGTSEGLSSGSFVLPAPRVRFSGCLKYCEYQANSEDLVAPRRRRSVAKTPKKSAMLSRALTKARELSQKLCRKPKL